MTILDRERKYLWLLWFAAPLFMIPFFVSYEIKKPPVFEIVLIAVICAIAVASRAAFIFVPNFKPILAFIIIAGICFGANAGFMCGAISMLVSNMMFGQGPWTLWQMLACGIIGCLSGLLAKTPIFKYKPTLIIYGITCGFLYGFIADIWTILSQGQAVNLKIIISTYALAIYFNILLAAATAIFLVMFMGMFIKKIDRLKNKFVSENV